MIWFGWVWVGAMRCKVCECAHLIAGGRALFASLFIRLSLSFASTWGLPLNIER